MSKNEMTLDEFCIENKLSRDTDAKKNMRRGLRKFKRDNATKFKHEKNDRWIFIRGGIVHKFLLARYEKQIASVKNAQA